MGSSHIAHVNLKVENYVSFSRFAEDLSPIAEDLKGFPDSSNGKESACNAGTRVQSLAWEDHLEKEMATHSSTLAQRILWTEEPVGLQSMRSQRVEPN